MDGLGSSYRELPETSDGLTNRLDRAASSATHPLGLSHVSPRVPSPVTFPFSPRPFLVNVFLTKLMHSRVEKHVAVGDSRFAIAG